MNLSRFTLTGLSLLILGCANTTWIDSASSTHQPATATAANLAILASSPTEKLAAKNLLAAQKIVVELYDQKGKSSGAGFIIATLNNAVYILTLSHLIVSQPHPRVNIFYRGDHAAKVVKIDERQNLALLKIEGGDLGNLPGSFYLSDNSALTKSISGIFTIGFPQDEKPWVATPLVYHGLKDNNLLLVGDNIDAGHAGAPLFYGSMIIGMIAGSSDWIYAISPEVIKKFLQGIIPEGGEILTQNEQRYPKKPSVTTDSSRTATMVNNAPNTTAKIAVTTVTKTPNTSNKTMAKGVAVAVENAAEKDKVAGKDSAKTLLKEEIAAKTAANISPTESSTVTVPNQNQTGPAANQALPASQANKPAIPSKSANKPANTATTQTPVSPLYEATLKSLREQPFNLTAGKSRLTASKPAAVKPGLPVLPVPSQPMISGNSLLIPPSTKEVKPAEGEIKAVPETPTSQASVKVPSVSQTGTSGVTLLNSLCKAVASNDFSTFRQEAAALPPNSNLFYLASNVSQAFSIQDQKAVLEHSLKFLFEAFSQSKQEPKSNCSPLLLKVKAEELEAFKKKGTK